LVYIPLVESSHPTRGEKRSTIDWSMVGIPAGENLLVQMLTLPRTLSAFDPIFEFRLHIKRRINGRQETVAPFEVKRSILARFVPCQGQACESLVSSYV